MSYDLKIVNGDLARSSSNDLEKVENSDKLLQDLLKIIVTPLNGNPFFPFYGCPLTRSLVGVAYESNFISGIAQNQLRNSLETLQAIQREQLSKTNQVVTPHEHIAAIENILVERNASDPRFFRIGLSVISKAFRRTETALNVRL